MIASCGFLENELGQFSKEEGVTLADSVGVDLGTRVKRLGAKEKARRKKRKVRFSLVKKSKLFQKNFLKVVSRNVTCGMMPPWSWRVHAVEMFPTERLNLRREHGSCCGLKKYELPVFVHGSIRP